VASELAASGKIVKPVPRGRVTVRLGKGEEDGKSIYSLCALAHKESRYRHLSLDEEGLRKQIDHDINATNTNGIILAERIGPDGKPEVLGLLSAVAGKLSFANVISCSALIFFIHPDARNSRAAILLLKAFEKWAKNRRAYEIAIHVTMGREDDARVSVLLDRYGFANSGGGSHFKELQK